jgi:NADH-quinone oxidoreductase subunit M
MAPLLGLIVFLGVYPKPMLERIEPAVERLVAHVEDHSDFRQPEVARTGTGGAAHGDAADPAETETEEEGH